MTSNLNLRSNWGSLLPAFVSLMPRIARPTSVTQCGASISVRGLRVLSWFETLPTSAHSVNETPPSRFRSTTHPLFLCPSFVLFGLLKRKLLSPHLSPACLGSCWLRSSASLSLLLLCRLICYPLHFCWRHILRFQLCTHSFRLP